MNSVYKNNIYKYDITEDDSNMALRYIDWKTWAQYPRMLNEDDFLKIKESNCIFASKFDENMNFDNYRKVFIKL